jgi:hypothetical protein
MTKQYKLPHNKQCSSCPFRVVTTVSEIPNYDPDQHESLRDITLEEGHETDYTKLGEPSKVMACHHRPEGLCIGWAANQIKIGNVGFRLNIASGLHNESFPLKTVGKQVENFQQTFK